MQTTAPARAAVLGARNLGGVITRDLLGRGADVATIARTAADLEPFA
jgi:Trk K+ transport system NAD-binding subunit